MHPDLKRKLRELEKTQQKIDLLNKEKTKLRQEVSELIQMDRQVGRGFQVGSHYICYNKKEVTGGLTQEYLAKSLYNYFGNQREAQDLFRYLMENRPISQKYQLDMRKRKPKN